MIPLSWKHKLAYKWCEEYGDQEHHKRHHDTERYLREYSMWCGNCRDGYEYINDVIREIKDRF